MRFLFILYINFIERISTYSNRKNLLIGLGLFVLSTILGHYITPFHILISFVGGLYLGTIVSNYPKNR
jgi:hypothetical protein